MTIDVLIIGAVVLLAIVATLSTEPSPPTGLPGSVVIMPVAPADNPNEHGADALTLLIVLMLAALLIAALT